MGRLAAIFILGFCFYLPAAAVFFLPDARSQQPPATREARLKALTDALRNENWEVREKAVSAAAFSRAPEVLPVLIEVALRDSNPRVRERGIWALGSIKDPRAVEPLISILNDKETNFRQRAMEALSKIGGREAVEALANIVLYEDNAVIRRIALDSLSEKDEDFFLEIVLPELENDALQVRKNAVAALAETKNPVAVEKFSELLIKENDPEFRRDLAFHLGELENRNAVKALVSALEDGNPEVRLAAVEALAKIGDPSAAGPLSKLLDDKEPFLRKKAAEALGELGVRSAVPLLSEKIESAPPDIRLHFIEALGAIPDERAAETLLRIALRDKDEAARREASRALVKSRGISDAEEPIESLKDRDPFVRANAAALLESIRPKKALGPLTEATLRDPDRKVRRSAARALGAIDGNLSANLLADALSDNDTDVRKNAVDAFALIGGIASVKPLIAALSDRDFRVRAAAAAALGELRARDAVDPLIESLNDSSPKVVHAASTSLEFITDQNFGTDYEQWKKWDRNE